MSRILLVLCTLTWWVLPGMGVIDLTVTWDPEWPVMLEAGWGVLFTVGIGLPFLVTAIRPRLASASLAQLYVVAGALLIGCLVGVEPQAWWIFAMLAIELPLLHHVARGSTLGARSLSPIMLGCAVVAAFPALGYAWDMTVQNRRSLITSDITNETDHYAIQAAVALTLVALPAVSAWWPGARRLLGTSTALMAAYLGLVSYHWVLADAGFSHAWSVAVMGWAALVAVTSWWTPTPARRTSAPRPSPRRPPVP